MCKNFSIDASVPTAYLKIKDYLYDELQPIIHDNRPLIFICIGSDRSTGDCLGPLVGYKLRSISKSSVHICGSLENPIHAKNIESIINKIYLNFSNPYIIAIDSSLGSLNNIGKIFIKNGPLAPGLALNKNLPKIGDMNITGIVNISGSFEFLVLQNTRLATVMNLAEVISKGIYHFTVKSFEKDKGPKSLDNIISLLEK